MCEVGIAGEPGRDELDLDAHRVMALAEGGHGHGEGLSDHCLHRVATTLDDGADVNAG